MVVFLLCLALLVTFGVVLGRVLRRTSEPLRAFLALQDQMAARRPVRRRRPARARTAPAAPAVGTVPFDPVPAPAVLVVPTGDGDEAWVFGTTERLDAMGPVLAWAPRYLDEWVTCVVTASDGVAAHQEMYGRLIALDTETSEALHACHAAQTDGRVTIGFVRDSGGRFHAVPQLGPVSGPAATAMPNVLAAVGLMIETDYLNDQLQARTRERSMPGPQLAEIYQDLSEADRRTTALAKSAMNPAVSAAASWLEIESIAWVLNSARGWQ